MSHVSLNASAKAELKRADGFVKKFLASTVAFTVSMAAGLIFHQAFLVAFSAAGAMGSMGCTLWQNSRLNKLKDENKISQLDADTRYTLKDLFHRTNKA